MYDITIDSADAVSIAWIAYGVKYLTFFAGIALAIFIYLKVKDYLKGNTPTIDIKTIGMAIGIIAFLYIFLN